MGVQSAINQSIGSVGAGVAIAKGVKAQEVKAEAIKQEQVTKQAQAKGEYLKKLGANEQMLSELKERMIKQKGVVKFEKNIYERAQTSDNTKEALKWQKDKYQRANLALRGMRHEKQGLQNSIKFIKEQLKEL